MYLLFVAQGVDGVELSRLGGGYNTKNDTHRSTEAETQHHRPEWHVGSRETR